MKTLPTLPNLNVFIEEQFFFEAQQRGIEKLSQGQKLKAVYEDIQTSYPELTELEVSKVMSNIIEYFGI